MTPIRFIKSLISVIHRCRVPYSVPASLQLHHVIVIHLDRGARIILKLVVLKLEQLQNPTIHPTLSVPLQHTEP